MEPGKNFVEELARAADAVSLNAFVRGIEAFLPLYFATATKGRSYQTSWEMGAYTLERTPLAAYCDSLQLAIDEDEVEAGTADSNIDETREEDDDADAARPEKRPQRSPSTNTPPAKRGRQSSGASYEVARNDNTSPLSESSPFTDQQTFLFSPQSPQSPSLRTPTALSGQGRARSSLASFAQEDTISDDSIPNLSIDPTLSVDPTLSIDPILSIDPTFSIDPTLGDSMRQLNQSGAGSSTNEMSKSDDEADAERRRVLESDYGPALLHLDPLTKAKRDAEEQVSRTQHLLAGAKADLAVLQLDVRKALPCLPASPSVADLKALHEDLARRIHELSDAKTATEDFEKGLPEAAKRLITSNVPKLASRIKELESLKGEVGNQEGILKAGTEKLEERKHQLKAKRTKLEARTAEAERFFRVLVRDLGGVWGEKGESW